MDNFQPPTLLRLSTWFLNDPKLSKRPFSSPMQFLIQLGFAMESHKYHTKNIKSSDKCTCQNHIISKVMSWDGGDFCRLNN